MVLIVAPGRATDHTRIQAGEAEMSVPAGWSVERDSQGPVILKRTDEGQLSAIVIQSQPLEGALPDAVRSAMHRGFADAKLKLDSLTETNSIFGLRGVSFDESVRHPQLRRRFKVCGVALNVAGRLHLAWLTTISNAAAEAREREFEQMIRSWKFQKNAATAWDPTKARKVPARAAGLYWGSKIQNRYNGLSGSMQMKAVRRYVLLLPTGQAYRGLPPGGRVLEMDFAERLREDPEQCGVYSIDGDEIVFEWPGPLGLLTTTRSPLEQRGDQLQFKFMGVDVSPVQPVSGLRVDGTYTASSVTTSNTAFSNTTASSERRLTLTSDGRYTKTGFVGVSFSQDSGGSHTSGAGSSRPGAQKGMYAIDGFRLTLSPDNGPAEHSTILIETPGPSPGALFIDGSAYLKSGR